MPTRVTTESPSAPSGTAFVLLAYTLTIFVSAALLFLVQPLVARMVLPRLGGSPAVWNTAVVFYQLALLGGYGYAYASTRWLSPRAQVVTHLALLLAPLAVLPLGLPESWVPRPDHPAASLLGVLTLAVGLPFLVVSTTTPLLQRWFVASGHPHGADPYFLYGSSNAGSLLALMGYPLVMERLLPLGEQAHWWTVGYFVFVGLAAICAALAWKPLTKGSGDRASTSLGPLASSSAGTWAKLQWLALAAVPVSLMLSVTTYLTTDLSAVPLLWVIPLAVYLLTFILTFARRPVVSHGLMLAVVPFVLTGLMFLIAAKEESTEWWLVGAHVFAFFIVAMACHGRLAALRPAPAHLTGFYLIVSLGGAVGGMFNALVAPVLFEHVYEYPISLILAAALLMPHAVAARPVRALPKDAERRDQSRRRRGALPQPATPGSGQPAKLSAVAWVDVAVPVGLGAISAALVVAMQAPDHPSAWLVRGLMFGLPLAAGLALRRRRLLFVLTLAAVFAASTLYSAGRGTLLLADRTFFGINRVVLQPSGRYRVLGHGNTTHGAQSLDPARRREPLTYFHPNGPLGQIFAEFNTTHPQGRVGVVGLGTGSIACYRKPDQQWTFYELDPAVVSIARDTGLFTFLQDCAPDARIVTGDARLSLQSASSGAYDLIVLDAYSSDAIPIHLITREAVALYVSKLAPQGFLAFNISNRHLDLSRVLTAIASDLGLVYRHRDDLQIDPRLAGRGMMPSQWAVIGRDTRAIGALATDTTWSVQAPRAGASVWSDDFNNLLSVFRW